MAVVGIGRRVCSAGWCSVLCTFLCVLVSGCSSGASAAAVSFGLSVCSPAAVCSLEVFVVCHQVVSPRRWFGVLVLRLGRFGVLLRLVCMVC